MIETLLKDNASDLLSALMGGGGLQSSEAESLLPAAMSGIGDALGSGDLDLTSLIGGGGEGVSSLLGKLDLGDIASQAGLDEEQTRGGLTSMIPVVMSLLGEKAGGAEGILSLLGGGGEGSNALGALGGIAGKLFGK